MVISVCTPPPPSSKDGGLCLQPPSLKRWWSLSAPPLPQKMVVSVCTPPPSKDGGLCLHPPSLKRWWSLSVPPLPQKMVVSVCTPPSKDGVFIALQPLYPTAIILQLNSHLVHGYNPGKTGLNWEEVCGKEKNGTATTCSLASKKNILITLSQTCQKRSNNKTNK